MSRLGFGLKNFLRSKMGQERLNSLLLAELHSLILEDMDISPCLLLLNSFLLIINAKYIMDISFETLIN